MGDASPDSVTSGAAQAPLGARGARAETSGGDVNARAGGAGGGAGPRRGLPFADTPRVLAVVLALALIAYAAVAADVVEGGRLSARDEGISEWVARSMPGWAEWIARALSWIGGWVGVTVIVALVVVWLARRGALELGMLLIVVALGGQLINSLAKAGYDRPRPTAGSPVDLPSSSSFPSGHAMTGVCVFGLLGLILARELTGGRRTAAIAGGFALGALIGASRVVLNVHFLTDVLGGAALGLAWLAACLLGLWVVHARRRRRYAEPS